VAIAAKMACKHSSYLYSPECVEKLFGNSQAWDKRLTISRIIAAYINASALAHSLS
jgi:hypothetical protein